MTQPRPNILLFLASDLGYGDLGCYGSPANRTPNLDRLAAGGLRFTDCHSNGCMCSPSRAALLTGRYQQRAGIEFVLNHHDRSLPPLSPDARTYGRAFKEAGYATGFFGVYHTGYLPEQSPIKLGFETFRGLCGGMDHHSHVTRWGKPNWWHGETPVEEAGYSTDLITNHALAFIDENRYNPFCLHIADFLVHFPWQGPGDPPDFRPGSGYDNPEAKYGSRPDRKQAYREMVEAMDRSVGRVIAKLESLGLAEKTLFLFASDHGGHHLVADNGPLSGAKGTLREGGHRIPALAWWPGTIAPGRLVDSPIMLMDLFPTFQELCGLPARPDIPFDGVSLLGLLTGGSPPPERHLFWRHGDDKAARVGRWKLLIEPGGTRLFDLAADLRESRDRSADQPAIVADLTRRLADWEADIPSAPRID
jgi:arylsulfatase A-like enzyme